MAFKMTMISLFFLLLVGCASHPEQVVQIQHQPVSIEQPPLTVAQKEQLMKKAKNYVGLIALYKKQLRNRQSNDIRYKLADTYYRSDDCDSALFQLSFLKKHSHPKSRVYYLSAQCLYQQKHFSQALQQVKLAISLEPHMARAYNLLGIISARMNDFISAKRAFVKARSLMYSDSIVLNNLALLDIYQQKDQAAIDKLMPLYRNGQADEKVRANLLLALAKKQQFELFKEVYGDADSSKVSRIYHQLQALDVQGHDK